MSYRHRISKPASTVLIGAALAGICAASLAQPVEEITVTAAREVTIGKTSAGVPIKEITVQSRVSFSDLNLTTDEGVKTLEARIRDAATSSCKDIIVQFPVQGSSDAECARRAVKDAMVQARQAIDAQKLTAGNR